MGIDARKHPLDTDMIATYLKNNGSIILTTPQGDMWNRKIIEKSGLALWEFEVNGVPRSVFMGMPLVVVADPLLAVAAMRESSG